MEKYGWDAVAEATKTAKAIAWNGCHKIYLAMDDEQVAEFRECGYGQDDDGSVLLMASPETDADDMYAYLDEWFEVSCGLRFIQAVWTNEDDPNEGFVNLIPQGWDKDDED